MKKYRQDLKDLAASLCIILVHIFRPEINIPYAGYLSAILIIGFLTYKLYAKIRYRKGKEDYLLVPHANDQFSKHAYIIVGILMLAGSITLAVYQKNVNYFSVAGLLLGVHMLLNGIFDLPNGSTFIEDGKIYINGGPERKVELLLLDAINIFNTTILLERIDGKKIQYIHFNFDPASAARLQHFLREKIPPSLPIKINNNLPLYVEKAAVYLP